LKNLEILPVHGGADNRKIADITAFELVHKTFLALILFMVRYHDAFQHQHRLWDVLALSNQQPALCKKSTIRSVQKSPAPCLFRPEKK
jgi:hypothetical protein